MSRLLLVRHGTTEFNTALRFSGCSDIGLSPKGIEQVGRLRDRLAIEKINVTYTSDLKRARLTAETVVSLHNGMQIVECPELREMNYGMAEGLTFAQIGERYPDLARLTTERSLEVRFPDGEGFNEVQQRIDIFLEKLNSHPDETVLIVSHNGPIRTMICRLLGMDLKHWWQLGVDNASLSIIRTYPRIALLSLLNDVSHLKQEKR